MTTTANPPVPFTRLLLEWAIVAILKVIVLSGHRTDCDPQKVLKAMPARSLV
jgi:hypothetical protein